MLESMRNQAQSWIAKLILGGIALSFALWGVGDYFMGSQVQTVAEIDGKPIVDAEFYQAYERQLNNYRMLLGTRFSKEMVEQFGLKQETIQTLINRKLMLEEAQRIGLTAPAAALTAAVQANPAFQSANGFDANRYKIITRNMGFRSTRDYEDEQRLNLMVDALQKAVIGSARVTDEDIRDQFNREFEKRVLSAIIVDPASMLKEIEVNEADARDYYEANLNNYQSPLMVKLNAVEISPETLAVDTVVDSADVESAYQERLAQFTDKESDKVSPLKEVYETLAADLRKEKAAEEAYKLSLDLDDALGMEASLASAAASVNLPVIEIAPISIDKTLGNDLLGSDRALVKTAFSTLPGEAINIQDLDDGRFVAIEVLERIEPTNLSFADAAKQVYADARSAAARAKAKELAKEIVAKAESESLDKLAQNYGQPKYISKPVRSIGLGDESTWLTPTMLDRAFKVAEGTTISEPVEVAKGFAVVQVKEVLTPAESEFNEQKESMRLEVEKSKGAVRFARWMASVRDDHEIVVHNKVLERF